MYYYENERALPIGFAYDTYMTKSQFEQIDPQLRAMVMLTTLVVDDADVEQVSSCLNEYTYEEYGGISLDRVRLCVYTAETGDCLQYRRCASVCRIYDIF